MSPSSPLVSVIIPCYNAAQWLPRTIESALAQTWSHVEIIVVDDGSTDGSLTVAKQFEARGVRVESIANGGAAAARNHGIALAAGDYFQFLDADDLLAPDKLQRQLERLSSAGPSMVATCSWARFHDDPAAARFSADPLWNDFTPVDWLVCSWQQHLMMATAAWLVPRRLIEQAGPWNTAFPQNPVDDMEYFSRVLLAADRVLFSREARVYYRSALAGSLSRRRTDDAWHAIFSSFELTAGRLLAREDSPRTRKAAATVLQRLVYEAYPRVPALRSHAERKIDAWGGCDLRPDAGPARRILQTMIGWRATKRLHDWVYRTS